MWDRIAPQLRRWRRWLAPGIGLKRWAVVHALGIVLITLGALQAARVPLTGGAGVLGAAAPLLLAALLVLGGMFLVLLGLRGILRAIDRVLFPTGEPTLVEVLRQRRALSRGPRVVALGGGTGLATLLRGLKTYTTNITAVVTVFDDGGSSGRLRRDLGMLPPGDIRDCLVALAEAEPLMTRLFDYRFPGGALDGHALGNLFLAGLTDVTGDLVQAVQEASRVLNIRGRVLPTTLGNVVLGAVYEDGAVVEGESQIPRARKPIRRVFLKPDGAAPLPEVLEAIAGADLIVIGPGSLFTSVIPNLLVRGVADALARARAPRVYICNVMTQPGETDGFTAQDHVRTLVEAVGGSVFTHVLVNTQMPRHPLLLRRYAGEGAVPVADDLDRLPPPPFQRVGAPVISEEEVLRHDPDRLARALLAVADKATAPAPLPAVSS